jgi:hypothetical protein
MLILVCMLAIWFKIEHYTDMSWWFLIPCTIIVALMGIVEGILIYKEIKDIAQEKMLRRK